MFFKKKSKRGLKGGAQRTYTDGADYTSARDEIKRARFSTDELYDDLDDEIYGNFDIVSESSSDASRNFKTPKGYENLGAQSSSENFTEYYAYENFSAQDDYDAADKNFGEGSGYFSAQKEDGYEDENFRALNKGSASTNFYAQSSNFNSQNIDFIPDAEKNLTKNKRKIFKERLNFINPFSPFKQIFSAIALIICVILAGVFVGDVLFGKRSFEVLRQLQREKAFLFTDVERLKKENAELQKLYLERRSLDPDLKK
nr:hypothetical protein [uncultured Campylobacter sp.]